MFDACEQGREGHGGDSSVGFSRQPPRPFSVSSPANGGTQTIGPLLVTAPCAATAVLPDVGFVVPCGPVHIYNAGKRPVRIQARADDAGGMAVCGVATVDQVLQPKAGLTLPALPASSSGQWVILWASQATLETIGLGALGAVALVLGLAGVGVVDIAKAITHGRKRRNRGR